MAHFTDSCSGEGHGGCVALSAEMGLFAASITRAAAAAAADAGT